MGFRYFRVAAVLFGIGFTVAGCAGGDADDAPALPAKKELQESYTYRLFVDNSGSMKGFTPVVKNGEKPTGYQTGLSAFMQHLFLPKLNVYNIYTFSSGIDTITEAKDAFVNDIVSGNLKEGNRDHTELEKILKNIIDAARKDEVTVVVSDFIFDGENGAEKITLKDQIAGHLESRLSEYDFSTLVFKFRSNWKDETGRPYYIFMLGNEKELNGILKFVLQTPDFAASGFDSYYKFSAPEKPLNAQVVVSSDYYDPHPPLTSMTLDKARMKDDTFKCVFKMDLGDVPLPAAWLDDARNYEVPDGYTLTVRHEEKPYTHRYELKSRKLAKGTIKLGLKNRPSTSTTANEKSDMPDLIYKFGEAYRHHYNTDNYFIKTITIN